MPTGACGINCDVCRLNLLGLCTTCGPGKSGEAEIKLAAQERILGNTCPILSCAVMNQKDYCLRDCGQFPCNNYRVNPYPYSSAYLDMQARRRKQFVSRTDPLGHPIDIPDTYWKTVAERELNLVCAVTQADTDARGDLVFAFLNQTLVLDLEHQKLMQRSNGLDTPLDNPLLALTALAYFGSVDRLYPLEKELISTKDMAQRYYFQGRNHLRKEPVLRRFGAAPEEFIRVAGILGGSAVDMADTACVLYPFSRVPVYYLIWDLETAPRLSVLFDRSIEFLMPPPIIWGLVNLVNAYLLSAD